jgi:mRNA interferase RelE/StbE
MYKVEYTEKALKILKKMNKQAARLIVSWIEKNLQNCEDPRVHGKALAADMRGKWRYRIGDYRLIANIADEKITILILNIGHRKDIYK